MIQEFIAEMRDEKGGFSFDKPIRVSEKNLSVVLPIIRQTVLKRGYIVLPEAKKMKIEDTGQINYVYVENGEDKPVLVSRGEIFRGKTQERVAMHDHIIEVGKGLRVAVRCIHQTRGISSSAKMEYGGRSPYDVDFSSQGFTWTTTANYARSVTASSGSSFSEFTHSDDLVKTMDGLSDAIDIAMKKIPFKKNQIGAAFLYGNKVKGLDVYDVPKSWDEIKKDVVKKEGADFVKEDNGTDVFVYKSDKVVKKLKEELGKEFKEKEIYNREYRLVELRSDKLIGEVLEWKGRIVHLTLWAK